MSYTWDAAFEAKPDGAVDAPSVLDDRIRILATELRKRMDSFFVPNSWDADPDGGGYSGLDIQDDTIKDKHIDWGTGANQVSAADVPIADAGSIITATEVEAALQEIMGDLDTHEGLTNNPHSVSHSQTSPPTNNPHSVNLDQAEAAGGAISGSGIEADAVRSSEIDFTAIIWTTTISRDNGGTFIPVEGRYVITITSGSWILDVYQNGDSTWQNGIVAFGGGTIITDGSSVRLRATQDGSNCEILEFI